MNFKSILTALKWLAAHWKLPVSAALAVASYGIVRRRHPQSQTNLDARLDAISEKVRINKIAFEQGAAAAKAEVDGTYAKQLAALTAEQSEQATKLYDDPAALAAYLVRVGGGGESPN